MKAHQLTLRFLKSFIFLFFSTGLFAQNQDLILGTQAGVAPASSDPSSVIVQDLKAIKKASKPVSPFDFSGKSKRGESEVFLDLKSTALQELLQAKSEYLELTSPVDNDHDVKLELCKKDILAPFFSVTTSSGEDLSSLVTQSAFYHGIIKGHQNSLVAVSIFQDEMSVFIDNKESLYTLGKVKNAEHYVFYNESKLVPDVERGCGTKDEDLGLPNITQDIEPVAKSLMPGCGTVYIYVETDYPTYTGFGGGNNTTVIYNYITGGFNQLVALYNAQFNNQIPLSLSGLKIWTVLDPYGNDVPPFSGVDAKRATFATEIQNDFTGHLAQLCHIKDCNNCGIAGVAQTPGLCSSYYLDPMFGGSGPYAYNQFYNVYENYPTFSASLNLWAHETGHQLGSPHTHACVWNGNNTAIDNCVPTTGGCSATNNGPSPPYIGTIMSYCNSSTLNFHAQVKTKILDTYTPALNNCLADLCTVYEDVDGDGFGSNTVWTISSTAPPAVSTNLDCNDNNVDIKPTKVEICGNSIDDNCNGVVDENTLSLDFDGTDDEVDLGTTLGNFGTNNFTIEGRIKTSAANKVIMSKRSACSAGNFWLIKIGTNGAIQLELSGTVSSGSTNIANGSWHSFAVVRNGNNLKIYVDGTLESSFTTTHNFTNPSPLKLGYHTESPCNNHFDGEMDEVRFWNKALSAPLINLYHDAFLPTGLTGLIAYYDFNNNNATAGGNNAGQMTLTDRMGTYNGTLNNFALNGSSSNWLGNPSQSNCGGTGCTPPTISEVFTLQPTCADPMGGSILVSATGAGTLQYSKDNGTTWQNSEVFGSLSPNSYNIKVRLQTNPTCTTAYAMNPVVIVAATGCGGTAEALDFDGSNDKIDLPAFDFYEGNFTVEGWINVGGSGERSVFSCHAASYQTVVYITVNTANQLRFVYRQIPGNAGGIEVITPGTVTGGWHHFAAVYDTDNKLRIYIDGDLKVTSTSTSSAAANGVASLFHIGYNSPTAQRYYAGKMDEFRVWNYAKTAAQIQCQMDVELSGTQTGLVTYYNFNQGTPGGTNTGLTTLNDLTANNNDGTLTGFALTGSTSNWVAPGPTLNGAGACAEALDLDGTDDQVNLGANLGNFGTGDFTIEAQIKTSTTSGYIVSKRSNCGFSNFWNVRNFGGLIRFELFEGSSNNATLTATTPINNNIWHHVAITRENGIVKIYIDGNEEANMAGTANINNTTDVVIGANPCLAFYDGQIDELRFWNYAKSASQIQCQMDVELTGSETGLDAYYNFNQGTPGGTNTGLTTLIDLTANNNDGTLTGFALTGATSNWVAPGPMLNGSGCGSCPNTLAIPGIIASGTYNAAMDLTSNGTVPNGNTVILKAGTSVELQVNFTVELGGVLEVLIEGCTPSFSPPGNGQ